MLLINRTPLHAAIVPNADEEDGIVALFVAALTVDVGGEELRLSEEQRPLLLLPAPPEMGDYHLTKGGASVCVTGHVYAANGSAHAAEARLLVGDRALSVAAFGRRVWQRTADGALVATAPDTFDRIAMTWENAFGGAVLHPARLQRLPGGDEAIVPEHPEAFAENTDGVGFYTEAEGAVDEPLPHLEDPEHLITRWDDRPEPVCFAPYPMHGGLRARFVMEDGVIDFSRHPRLMSRACPRATFDEVPPGTRVGVTGMRPGGEVLTFEVPPPPLTADVTVGDRHRELDLYVDAIDIDAEAAVARVVYRALFSYPLVRYEKRTLYVRPSPHLEKLIP